MTPPPPFRDSRGHFPSPRPPFRAILPAMAGNKVYYQCQRCANCCRWPGDVRITDDEVRSIAAFLEIPEAVFLEQFTRLRHNRRGLSLIEKPNHECIFLDGIDCRIQPVKPAQCAGFPNHWNFPGWQDHCEAIPVEGPGDGEADAAHHGSSPAM